MKVELNDLITQKEAAEIRGVTPQSIHDLVKRGKLTTISLGKRKFLSRKQVKNYKPSVGGRPKGKSTKKRTHRKSS
jgi:hypothetical protein